MTDAIEHDEDEIERERGAVAALEALMQFDGLAWVDHGTEDAPQWQATPTRAGSNQVSGTRAVLVMLGVIDAVRGGRTDEPRYTVAEVLGAIRAEMEPIGALYVIASESERVRALSGLLSRPGWLTDDEVAAIVARRVGESGGRDND